MRGSNLSGREVADGGDTALEVLAAVEAHAQTALTEEFDRAWLRSLRQQAEFGWRRLGAEARERGSHAPLLEVGGGPFLLSLVFAAEGHPVVALEPRGLGFEQLWRIQDMVLAFAAAEGITFSVLDQRVEQFETDDRFDLAYSVNVFEHIEDVEAGLENAISALAPGGALRILCANYSFPYEPHFSIPIVVNKSLTRRIFAGRIARREAEAKSDGLWRSLNFVSSGDVKRIAARHGWTVEFDRSVTLDILNRFRFDASLRERHARYAPVVDAILGSGAARLIGRLPAGAQPYMDARITRPAEAAA